LDDGPLNSADIEVLAHAVVWCRKNGASNEVTGHKDWMSTACPGHAYAVLKQIRDKADAIQRGEVTPAPVDPNLSDARKLFADAGFSGENLNIAVAVARAESDGYIDAVGDYKQLTDPEVNKKWGPSVGLTQVRTLVTPKAYAEFDKVRDINKLRDPAYQAHATKVIFEALGWDAWTVYRTGSYKQFLGTNFTPRTGHPERDRWNLDGTKPSAPKPPTPAPPAPVDPYANIKHKVTKGETLSGIAAKYGTTYQYLAYLNGLSDPNKIKAGQVLWVGWKGTAPGKYKVQKGDTLSKIAKFSGTTWQRLKAVNKIANANLIKTGQVILIK
jgi:LysM repeat protein